MGATQLLAVSATAVLLELAVQALLRDRNLAPGAASGDSVRRAGSTRAAAVPVAAMGCVCGCGSGWNDRQWLTRWLHAAAPWL